MPKFMVYSRSRANLSIEVYNPTTKEAFSLVLEPGMSLDLLKYAGSIEACEDCLDVYKFKRINELDIYKDG